MGCRGDFHDVDRRQFQLLRGLVIDTGRRCPGIDKGQTGNGSRKCASLLKNLLGNRLADADADLDYRPPLKQSDLWRDGHLSTIRSLSLTAELGVKNGHAAIPTLMQG